MGAWINLYLVFLVQIKTLPWVDFVQTKSFKIIVHFHFDAR